MTAAEGSKICVRCGQDCSSKPRTKDSKGRYFCKSCYELALARPPAAAVQRAPAASKSGPSQPPLSRAPGRRAARISDDDRGAYDVETSAAKPAREHGPPGAPLPQQVAEQVQGAGSAPLCPSCGATLPPGTLVCIPCGINIATGRSIVTAEQGDTEQTYEHARGILWFVSWILILGLIPISSEAHGTRRPYALRIIAILTIFFSMWMWWFEWTDSPRMHVLKNQLLWAGNARPDEERIEGFYRYTGYGDYKAFERKKMELAPTVPESELAFAALNALPPTKRCFGEFHLWQLITHAFLHADFLHLGGNLLFLFIFGSRINALIGNAGVLLLYPLLAIVSGLAQMASMAGEMPSPALGASGAIFGLAGMYFVLFPISPVHVAAFIRVPILLLKFFKCRGFWILLFYVVVMNVLPMALGWEDGTAHWAHMGGFLMGMAVALALLITRGVNARGTDLISALLGQRAWNLIGKPSQWLHTPEGEGWLTRWRLVPTGLHEDVLTGLGIPRQG